MNIRSKATVLAILCIALSSTGCALFDSSGDNSSQKDTQITDAGDAGADASEDIQGEDIAEDIADTGVQPDACIPKACPEGEFGTFDDGCGATMECALPCQDGTAQLPSCGTCGLGQRVCAAGETGEGTCTLELGSSVLDETMDPALCEQLLIFVDAAAGDDANDGSRERPFKTYAKASAVEHTPAIIILGTGPTSASHFKEPLIVRDGVSVIGGFDPSKGFLLTARPSTFDVPASDTGDVYGLKAVGIDDVQTRIAHILIKTDDASSGYNNYGAYIQDSDELSLSALTVEAGQGGPGASGEAGANGLDGGDGQSALDLSIVEPIVPVDHPPTYFLELPKGAPVVGMTPGSTVAPNCQNTGGGDGGQGLLRKLTKNKISDPEPGQNAPGSLTPGGNAANGSESDGGDGASGGQVLALNVNGSGGTPGEFGGAFASNIWVASGAGDTGGYGQPGKGGGGGGGANSKSGNDGPLIAASPGAGGGAGGCGGEGGLGGQPGQGSFGLVLIDSKIAMNNSTFHAGKGGVGGDGGDGGDGGVGGTGGMRGKDWIGVNSNNEILKFAHGAWGGSGGDGSDGTKGGAGGGGAGGTSVGAYCSPDSSILDGTDVAFFAHEDPARGGAGGLSADVGGNGGLGNPGAPGVLMAHWGCD